METVTLRFESSAQDERFGVRLGAEGLEPGEAPLEIGRPDSRLARVTARIDETFVGRAGRSG